MEHDDPHAMAEKVILSPSPLTFSRPVPPTVLHFMGPGNEPVLTIDLADGTVTLAEGWGVDEAAALFWDRVRALAGPVRPPMHVRAGDGGS